ncbi:H-NS histone family protein [Aquabacterium soli]|uniref:H-NS histone family protein n=1 Tax=Aquabacterium soli TaxID=2493092 RepID=A0A3R8S022_9BURK|nr:H-NS histone family protein [Aquabacterium soli]RRS01193.1 H-NS histone family protein [Aquabacterium soli]
MSLADLLAQKANVAKQLTELDKQLSALRSDDRKAAIAQIQAQMREHGLTVADLELRALRKPRVDAKEPREKPPVKFKHPSTGEAWTGRGLKPKWLQREIAQGASLDSFRV